MTPGGSSTVHSYKQTVHRTKNETEYTEQNTRKIIIHKYSNKNTQFTKLNRSIQNTQPYIQRYKTEPKEYERMW